MVWLNVGSKILSENVNLKDYIQYDIHFANWNNNFNTYMLQEIHEY